jgi:DNA-binding NtrC family response regulator
MASQSRGVSPTVLVIDTDSAMRTLLKDWLEHGGFRVVEEPSADRMFTAAETTHLDAVVLAKETAGPTGFDVLPAFRQEWPEVPVIVVTAFGGDEAAEEALRLGARTYLEKPFQLRTLLEAVRDATKGGSERTEPP